MKETEGFFPTFFLQSILRDLYQIASQDGFRIFSIFSRFLLIEKKCPNQELNPG